MKVFLRLFLLLIIPLTIATNVKAEVVFIDITTENPKCPNESNGYVVINNLVTSGATGPTYNIRIVNPFISFNVGDTIRLPKGSYTILVTDQADGRTAARSFALQDPFQLFGFPSSNSPSCFGASDGDATITVFDGTFPYTFLWSDNQTTQTATGLSDGKYYVTVTDNNGCSITDSATVTQPAQIDPNVTTTNVACFGDATGSATSSPINGVAPFTYNWSTGTNGTNDTEGGLVAGNYSVTVIDANNCQNSEAFSITQPAAPLNTSISGSDPFCNGAANGFINTTASGGTSPYTFNWDDIGVGTQNRTGLMAGTYTVTISDNNGCTSVETETLIDPAAASKSISGTDILCNGDATGDITITVTGGTPGTTTFDWSNSTQTTDNTDPYTSTISGLTEGKYYVTITNVVGCVQIDSLTLTEPALLVPSFDQENQPSCNGGSDGSILANATGGVAPYTFNWPGNPNTNPLTGISAGNYTVTVVDANGCQQTLTSNLGQPNPIVPTLTPSDVSCNGGSDGSILAAATDGTPPYTFNWPGNPNTNPLVGITAGTYTVTVVDAGGCTATASTTVNEPAAGISINLNPSDVFCFGTSTGGINTSVSGGTPQYTFAWNDGPTTQNRSSLTAGTYTVVVTDANGCTASQSTTVGSVNEIMATITADSVSCNGFNDGRAYVTYNSGGVPPVNTFSWSNGGNTDTINNLTAGKYYLTITDIVGCQKVDSVTIEEPTPLVIDPPTSTDPLCNGSSDGTISIDVSGGTPSYSFLWNDNSTNEDRTGLAAGNYSVTVTDKNGCTNTVAVTLTDPLLLVASIDSLEHASCNGLSDGFARVAATGGTGAYTYSWQGGPTTAANPNLGAGTYNVTVTDNNGCTATTSATITEPNAIIANATVVQDAQCAGLDNGEVTANATGGTPQYTYFWDPGNINSQTINGLAGGSYTVTVVDGNGCTVSETVVVNQPNAITFTTSKTDLNCNGDNSGTASVVNPQGGTAPYTYNWTPGGQTTITATGLSAQSYTVLVTDNNGCTNTGSVTITEPTVLSATITSSSQPSCNGVNDGTATVTATGGTVAGNYTYSWAPDGETTATISNKGNGTNTVTVTDDNGCTATTSITFTSPTSITISTDTLANVNCVGGNNGYIGISASGGSSPYTFDWDNIAGANDGPINAGLSAGNYNVTVTDAAGCFVNQAFTISEPAIPFTVSIVELKRPCTGSSDGSLTVTESNGTGPYTYNWTGTAQTTDTVTGLAPGFYLVNVTDANGCIASANTTLTPSNPIIGFNAATINDVLCFGDSTGNAGAIAFGGTGALTFTWSNGIVTGSPSVNPNLKAGTYTVTVNDENACTDTRTVTISEPAILDPNTTSINVSCSGTADGSITSTPTGGTAPYSFNWSTGASSVGITGTISNLTPNTYSLTVTDDNGCDTVETFTITKDVVNYTFLDSVSNETCDGDCDGSIRIFNLTGGVNPITYTWSNGASGASISNLCPGSYTVTISDNNNCDTIQSYTIAPGNLVLANVTTNPTSCGANNGDATSTPSGGNAPYTFNWSNGAPQTTGTTSTITNLASGNYDITVTDAIGCNTVEAFTIGAIAGITFDTTVTHVLGCFGDCSGSIAISNLAGGTTPYTFTWNGTVGANNIQNLCAGNYLLNIADANGCDTNLNFTITQPSQLDPSLVVVNAGCIAGSTGSATSTPTGGTAPYNFNWSNGTSQTAVLTGSMTDISGNYSLTVTDANGCDTIQAFTITQDVVNYTFLDSVSNETCDGDCDGSIRIFNLTGGVNPITYTWSNGASGASISNLCPGNYTVTISDNNNCDTVQSYTIAPGNLVLANVTTNPTSCGTNNGDATSTPSGGNAPYTFNWSTGATQTTGTTSTITNLASGNYDITVTDAIGCNTVEAFTIGAIAGFTFDTTITHVLGCFGDCSGSIAISNLAGGTTPYTFTWNGTVGANNIQNLCAGNYLLNIADANGCDTNLNFTITQPSQLDPSLVVVNASCSGATNGTATSTPSGGNAPYNFNWSNGTSQTAALTGSMTDVSGNYSLTVTDANGCDTIQAFTIGGAGQIYTYTDTVSDMSCNGICDGYIEIRGLTGGVAPITYTWSNSVNGPINATLCAGTYTVTISDANSCDSIATYTIIEPNVLTATTSSISDTCVQSVGRAEVTSVVGGTMPYTYSWPGNISTTSTAANIVAGTYDVTIEDNSGCSIIESIVVNNFSTFSILAIVDSVSCKDGSDGEISISTIGGVNPVTYNWTGGLVGATPKGLETGNYHLTVTDAAGCAELTTVTVDEPDTLTINISTTDESCTPGNDGSAVAFGLGGTPSYTYSWSAGTANGNTTTGLTAGLYTATIVDKNGCSASDVFEILPTAPFSVNSTTTKATCNGGTNGTIAVTVNGAVAPVTYSWSGGLPPGPNQTGLAAGSYAVTITDATTCSRQTTISIIEEDPITATVVATDESCTPGNDAYALATVNGGVQPYTYTWLAGTPFNDSVADLTAGAYNVTIEDAAGCSEIVAFNVQSGSDIDGGSVVQNATCFGDCDGSIVLNPTGGTGTGYTFAWDDGSSSNTRNNLCLGIYTVTISDDATPPCTKIENIVVLSPDRLTTSTFPRSESCSPGGDGGTLISILGGTAPMDLQSSAGNVARSSSTQFNIGNLSAGSYFVTITDANGCTLIQPFNIITSTPPTVTSSTVDATCNGGDDGQISIVASGGANPLTYNWTGGLAGADPADASAGTYTVTITDGKGCEVTETVTVGEATQIDATFAIIGESCSPGSDGSVTATTSGGTGPYTYDWGDGNGNTSSNSKTGLTAGNYDVTITDNLGCTEVIPFIINSDAPFNLTSNTTEVSCSGLSDASITLTVTGATGTLTYLWDNGLLPNSSQSGLAAGVYNVTITDAGTGCTETANFNFIDPSPISIANAVTNESCSPGNDGTILVTPSGGTTATPGIYTYQWSNGLPNSDNQVGLAAGTYDVTVLDDNGCSATESITVNPSAPFNLDLDSTDIICNGGSDGTITVNTDANNPTYQWDNGLLPLSSQTGLSIGTYCVTVTDNNGCSETDCIVINEPSPVAGVVTTTPESCVPGNDGTATAVASGGTVNSPSDYIYSWSNGMSGASLTGLSAGSYDVTILDINGCDVIIPFTVGSNAAYTVSLDSTDVTCNGLSNGTITLTTTAINPTFAWSNGLPSTQNQTGLSADTYTVTVTEPSTGCTETATITVNEPSSLSATITTTDENCNPGNDGTATAAGNGGTTPYTFNWSNGTSNNPVTGLSAGNYDVTIIDGNGCTSVEPFTIGNSAPFTVNLDSTDITCNGLRNGTITTTTTAINPGFAWSNGLPATQNQIGLAAGTYTVTITEPSSGCIETATIIINEPSLIMATVNTIEESCSPGNDGAASIVVTGGTSSSGSYTIDWSNGMSGTSIANLTAGNYDVTVTDDNGCTIVEPFTVGSSALFFVGLDSTDVSCFGLSDGTITLTTSAVNPFFQWSSGLPATKDQTGLVAGTYSVTVTSRLTGCTETSSIVVNEPSQITPTIVTTPESCNPGNDGGATASAIGGTGNYTFDWSTGDLNTTSISNIPAGSYDVTVTDDNGCTVVEPFSIGSTAPFIVDLDSTDVTCNGLSDGTITLTTTAINPTFAWNSGLPATQNQNNLSAGTYNVTITEPSSGCSETQSIVVNEPLIITPFVVVTNETCSGNDGTAVGSATGGTTITPGVYSYAWSNGQSGTSVTGLTAGNYDVTVTDDNGCTAVEPFIIGADAPFIVNIDSTDITCNGFNDGTITLTTNAINPTFVWDNGLPGQANHSNLAAGTYNVTVTEPSSGCTETGSISVNEPTIINLSITKTDDGCTPGFDGTATVNATGGTAPLGYTYLWNTNQSTAAIALLGPFTFTVTVTDGNGCTATESVKINKVRTVQPNELVIDESCNGACDASIALNPSGGSGTYSYLWNTGETTRTRTGLCGGNYLVTISDGLSCDTVVSIDIISNFPLVNSISTTDQSCTNLAVCDGGAVITSSGGVAPYTYDWPSGTILGVTSDTAKSLCVGNYNVTVSDASGCSIVESFVINGPAPITATFNTTDPGCALTNGSITVIASGGSSSNYTYQWYDNLLNPLSSTTDILSGIGSGIYFVDITDNTGCSARFSTSLTDIGSETITVSTIDASCINICDGEVTVSFNCQDPNCSIDWFDAVTGTSLGISTNTINNLCAGDYYVEVTNNSGCKSIESFTIASPSEYVVNAQINNVSCNSGFNGSISLTVTGGSGSINYNWAPGPITGQGTANVSGLTAGIYSVTISDGSICDTILTYQVTEPNELMATFNSVESTCGLSDGIINATVTGGSIAFDYDYQWLDAASNPIAGQINPSINGLAAGTYFLRVRDDNLCEKVFITTLGTTNGPIITIDSTKDITCFSDNNGAIYTTVSGSNAPFTYNWLPQGQTNEDIRNLTAGTYTVGVTNSIGCVTFDTVTISGPAELMANIVVDDASCGLCNGIARITASGGSGQYTYLWSNGSTVDTAANLCGGSYSMILSDSSGCSKTFNFSVNTNGGPTGETITTSNASCASSCDGSATVVPIGGIAPYTYLWLHNGATTNSLSNLCAGNYTLQVSDVKGCSRSVNIEILSPAAMSITPTIVAQTCNVAPCDGSIRVDVNGGTSPYTYSWSPGGLPASNSLSGLCSGIYNLTVTDANGCTLTESLSVPNSGVPLNASPTATDVNCFGSCDGSLISNITILTDYNYQWFNDQGTAISPINGDLVNSVCAGDYFLEITSLVGGCKSYENVTVGTPDSIALASSIVKNISCNGSCDGEIFISTIGGNLLYDYSWDDPNNQDGIPATNLCAGTYAVTATDANGCSATTSVTLVDPPVLTLTINSSTDVNCSSDCDGTADVSANGGTIPYTFDWSGGQSGSNPTDLCFGPNIITLTDATGCSITDTVFVAAADTVLAIVPSQTLYCGSDPVQLKGETQGPSINSAGWYIGDPTSLTLFTTNLDTTITRPFGDYTFYLVASNGSCSDTTEFSFKVAPTPFVGLASSISIFKDEIALFRLSNQDASYSYMWTPGKFLNDSTIAEPQASPRESITYTVMVTDTNGCTYKDSINVIYTKDLAVPSGISPNGDGVNDTWEIDFLEDFPRATVMIYNRWGELLYEQKNGYRVAWDGTYEGKALPIGTYYYVIDLKSDRFEPFTGPITIVK